MRRKKKPPMWGFLEKRMGGCILMAIILMAILLIVLAAIGGCGSF